MTKKVGAVILAAGTGSRMNSSIPKQYMLLGADTVLRRSIKAFLHSDCISSITVVVRCGETDAVRDSIADLTGKPMTVVEGGPTRSSSALIGVNSTPDDTDFVAIHDAARCLVDGKMIRDVVLAAIEHGAATAGTFCTDTVKLTSDGYIEKTLDRTKLFMAQTPQVFGKRLYLSAASRIPHDASFTDDNMIMEYAGYRVYCVETGKTNIKITTPDDFLYADYILNSCGRE